MTEPCCPGYTELPSTTKGAVVEFHDMDCPTLPPPGWDDRGDWPPAPGSQEYSEWGWAIPGHPDNEGTTR